MLNTIKSNRAKSTFSGSSKLKTLTMVGIVTASAFFLGGCTNSDSVTTTTELPSTNLESPARPAEVNGYVKSIEGNEIVIANEIKDRDEALTEEEKAAQQAERQSLSPEERQASRQATTEEIETENLTLIIPVGIPVVKSSGTADGTMVNGELSDIKTGTYLSIWLNGEEVEFVKLKGVN
jgi:hypothetical protein